MRGDFDFFDFAELGDLALFTGEIALVADAVEDFLAKTVGLADELGGERRHGLERAGDGTAYGISESPLPCRRFGGLQELDPMLGLALGFFHAGQTCWRDESVGFGVMLEPELCAAVGEQQAVFGTAGEHAVRLVGALGDEIVDEDADVALVASDDQRRLLADLVHGVDTGKQALRRGFFVAGRAIDLAGEEEVFDLLGFE